MPSWTCLSPASIVPLLAREGRSVRSELRQWAHAPLLRGLDRLQWERTLATEASVLRATPTVHVSTSALVFVRKPTGETHALLLWHLKAREWVYPGGHADGDWNLLRSALREVAEETGLSSGIMLHHPEGVPPSVPALVQRIEVAGHSHHDAVFFLEAPWESAATVRIDPSESANFRWCPPEGDASEPLPFVTLAALDVVKSIIVSSRAGGSL
jgi:8-oxo-dGTP pyrophosphatase MutT (NUDIX family)